MVDHGTPPHAARATINDVARSAGVSRQTVSNVLNKPDRVRADTRERVEAAISALSYRPHFAAQSMRARRAGAVGVELNAAATDSSDTAAPLLRALVVAAPRLDVHIVPFAHPTQFPAVDGYRDMTTRRLVDAFVFADTHAGDPRPQWLHDQGIPFAAFGRLYGMPHLTTWADVDGHDGTRRATDHLLESDYRTIGYLGWPVDRDDAVVGRARRDGWRGALAARATGPGPEETCAQDLDAAMVAARALLAQLEPGDGVVCASDLLALGVAHAAGERGWRLGPDLGLVGFDGSPTAARHHLSTIAQPFDALAEVLLGLVHDQLGGADRPPEGALLAPTLEVRASSLRHAAGGALPPPIPTHPHDPVRPR